MWMADPDDLPAFHMVTALAKLNHGSTIETPPSALRSPQVQDLLELLI
jgi:hypothetical protein